MKKLFSFFKLLWAELRKPAIILTEEQMKKTDIYDDGVEAEEDGLNLGFLNDNFDEPALFDRKTHKLWFRKENYDINPKAIEALKARLSLKKEVVVSKNVSQEKPEEVALFV